jgi:hypothetical protein
MKTLVTGALALILLTPAPARAQMGSGSAMPDVKQMSGQLLPAGDVEAGTVLVRVVRGALDKPLAGQNVQIIGDTAQSAKTNDAGRAEFKGLKPGSRIKATVIVDGEYLESQEFPVPATGGVRTILVATDPEAAKRAEEDKKLAEGPAIPGIVVLGEESRFVFELGDDGLTVFNIFQIVNTARVPVQPPTPVVFEVPAEASGTSLVDGSSDQAKAAGKIIEVAGPFKPGPTLVQFAYTMPYPSSGDVTVQQKLPIAMNQLTVMAQKVGDMHLTSPQMSQHGDRALEGQTYIVGQGPALKAGETVTFTFSGLPHTSTWPRNLAVAIALVILAGGAWSAARAGSGPEVLRRRKLEKERDRLFAELASLEQQQRAGTIDENHFANRRRDLITSLERLYGELDEEAAVGRAS